ncbi:MAG: phosphotriesterase [Opitutales bacterium]
MSFVRTVLGDLAPEALDWCGAHEHIVIAPSYATEKFPEFLLDDVEKIVAELCAFHDAGGRAMVDSMPCAAGRDVRKLAEVSRRSKIHIVAPTGAHLAKYYPPRHWSEVLEVNELVDLFVADIEDGIDALDYSGPVVRRTTHRAGVIKVAGGQDRLSSREQKIFIAAAQAQARTGCPILTHTEQGTAAEAQLDSLEANGADLAHVVLSHLDRNPDADLHRRLMQRGATLEYDSAFRWKGADNPTQDLLRQLMREFPNQIVLGMDAARSRYWRSYGGTPGLDFLPRVFAPQLRQAGLTDAHLHALFVANPARVYTFQKPLSPSATQHEQTLENCRTEF